MNVRFFIGSQEDIDKLIAQGEKIKESRTYINPKTGAFYVVPEEENMFKEYYEEQIQKMK